MKVPFHRADPDGPCFVCGVLTTQHQPVWYDHPVREEPGVALALLGVGAIVPGYLLVFPTVHVTSFAQVPADQHQDLARFVDDMRSLLERQFGPAVLFEHAGCQADDVDSSACVAHAHIHLWAIGDRVELMLPAVGRSFPDLPAFLSAADGFVAKPYLLAQNAGGDVHVGPSVGVPQYFRRQIAAQLGRRDEWDYAAFPHEAMMSHTLARLPRGS